MPTPTAGVLIDSGTRVIAHAIGGTTSISIGSGSYGRGATVVAVAAGQSGTPFPNTTHKLEVVVAGVTFDATAGSVGSAGGVETENVQEAQAFFGGPSTFDAGFTIRLRSPTATFDGVLGYAFFTAPVDLPSQLFLQNRSQLAFPLPFSSDSGTISLPTGFFTLFGTPNLFTYGSKAGYALHGAGGGLFGTDAADWTGPPGWVNAARIFSTNGSVSIGFYNLPGIYSVDWAITNPPSGETNSALVDVLCDVLNGAVVTARRTFAAMIGD